MTTTHTASANTLQDQAGNAAALLKIMANHRRLVVLSELACFGERSVSELEAISGLRQSALSQHLAKMRQHGIVATRRSAQTIYYSLASHEARILLDVLCRLYEQRAETVVASEAGSALAG